MAGSGRGNKGIFTTHDDNRPICPECDELMISNGKREWKCKPCNFFKPKNPRKRRGEKAIDSWGYDTEKAQERSESIIKRHNKTSKYVITSAQNNTPPNKSFLASLKNYCKRNNAELIVIASHYQNLSALNRDDEKQWYEELIPYLVHGDISLGHLSIQSHIKVQATAVKPLSSMESIAGDKWTVFGHPRQHLVSVATPASYLPKMMFTTGSVTKKSYSVSKAGAKAEFNHVVGALVVEFNKNGSEFPHIRQINANGKGHFYDLDKHYTADKVTGGHRVEALIPGDEHEKFNIVEKVTYTNKNSICKTLKPKAIVRNDVLDGYAGSHHHLKDPLIQFKKHYFGENDYRAELQQCIDFINRTTPKDAITLIVPSNHHDHLKQWLDKADANVDHVNSLLISELGIAMRQAVMDGRKPDPFILYASERLKCKFKFLSRNDPYFIKGIGVDQHGDVGPNGSRGSPNGFAKSTFKCFVGHSHSAYILDGAYGIGKSTGRMEYERGHSSHSNTHGIIYKDGKRSLITIINGQWRA